MSGKLIKVVELSVVAMYSDVDIALWVVGLCVVLVVVSVDVSFIVTVAEMWCVELFWFNTSVVGGFVFDVV